MPVATDQLATAWEGFFRTTRRLRSRAGKRPIEGLSLPQYHLLEALRDDDELTVGVLAEAAGVAPPTATRMLDCLERDGYVVRRHSEEDRRAVLVSLTPSGRVALQAAHQQVSAWRRRVFESLEPGEREQAAALLTRLNAALEEQLQ
ncbi:MAG TPA: MarR family transcriptional regulator [Solirubrobacteraceae bacterium]|nr:MarR family transcriptional regulator [Solirubrobacteraceae bacterium]